MALLHRSEENIGCHSDLCSNLQKSLKVSQRHHCRHQSLVFQFPHQVLSSHDRHPRLRFWVSQPCQGQVQYAFKAPVSDAYLSASSRISSARTILPTSHATLAASKHGMKNSSPMYWVLSSVRCNFSYISFLRRSSSSGLTGVTFAGFLLARGICMSENFAIRLREATRYNTEICMLAGLISIHELTGTLERIH